MNTSDEPNPEPVKEPGHVHKMPARGGETHDGVRARYEACDREVRDVLRRHNARLIAVIDHEPIGQGPATRFLTSARPMVALDPID